ncbi:MAG: D-isomer specific 2-hydroxyacid dehydrogenase NAD-binding protein [Herbinix sp.]|nr:D-isomer specific 2-hydroxyacid dehydrogenase NAD-binding protein [Herbinix sp.]
MKIVVLDGYTENPGDLSWSGLQELGELKVYDRCPQELVAERIGDAQIIITNKTVITEAILEQCPKIKYIGVLATGYNVIDIAAAKSRGIIVTNIPSYGTDAVSQFAIALLLELCHHVGAHSDSVKRGDWSNCKDFCYWNYPLLELAGKTMGIIGFGKIGRRTAQIAEALGMNILALEPGKIAQEYLSATIRQVSLEELLQNSDVISLHCPLFPETMGIINQNTLKQMKDGVMIINTSRGPLIVEKDLRDALITGKVAGAAVDVVSTEPITMDNPLYDAPNIIITPHIAWAPKEARQRLMDIAVDNLRAYIQGSPTNIVS